MASFNTTETNDRNVSVKKETDCKTTFLALTVTTLILHNIQSSSSGQNNNITSEVAANPLLIQNCNKTCKAYKYLLLLWFLRSSAVTSVTC